MGTLLEYEEALRQARKIGSEHGESAAEWWLQENVGSRVQAIDGLDKARGVVTMMSEGDPALHDSLPEPDLSGEWADGYSSGDLYEDVMGDRYSCDFGGEIAEAYEEGFVMARDATISARCQEVVAGD